MSKVRLDFVTNSSSSSFIISTNNPVPKGYENSCNEITKENLYKIFKEEYQWNTISYNDDEELQKIANLTDEQMLLIKIAIHGDLHDYIELKEKVSQNTENKIYRIFEDRDWLYDQEDLNMFIKNSEILSHETDL